MAGVLGVSRLRLLVFLAGVLELVGELGVEGSGLLSCGSSLPELRLLECPVGVLGVPGLRLPLRLVGDEHSASSSAPVIPTFRVLVCRADIIAVIYGWRAWSSNTNTSPAALSCGR